MGPCATYYGPPSSLAKGKFIIKILHYRHARGLLLVFSKLTYYTCIYALFLYHRCAPIEFTANSIESLPVSHRKCEHFSSIDSRHGFLVARFYDHISFRAIYMASVFIPGRWFRWSLSLLITDRIAIVPTWILQDWHRASVSSDILWASREFTSKIVVKASILRLICLGLSSRVFATTFALIVWFF